MNIEMEEQVQFLFYQGREGTIKIQVIADAERETIWATQASMADIFNVEVNTINYHLKNIFSSGELDENSVIRKIRITAIDGKTYNTNTEQILSNYNLEEDRLLIKYSAKQYGAGEVVKVVVPKWVLSPPKDGWKQFPPDIN